MAFNSSGDWTLTSVVLMGCWLSLLILIGVFGNILVIIVSLQGTRVRTRGKSLIVSMACADMLESVNMIFMLITIASYGRWIYSEALCVFHGFISVLFIVASMYSLMLISVNRYFMVVKTNQYNKVFSTLNIVIMLGISWLTSFLLALLPLLGWSKYVFQSNKATCMFLFSTSISYSILLIGMSVPGPLVVILFCSYKIFLQVKQHRNQVSSIGGGRQVNVEEIRITKTLFIIIMAYLICFIPPATSNFVEMALPNDKIPFAADVFCMTLLFTNHANNPVIYGFFNRQYRRAFKKLFYDLFPIANRSSIDSSVKTDASHSAPSTVHTTAEMRNNPHYNTNNSLEMKKS